MLPMKRFRVVSFLFLFLLLVVPATANATGTLDQEQTHHESEAAMGGGPPPEPQNSLAQTFTAGLNGKLGQVELFLYKAAPEPALPLNVEIRTVVGGAPSATVLASAIVPASSVPACCTGAFFPITFTVPAPSVKGTQYAIVAYTEDSNFYVWGATTSDVYPGGAAWLSLEVPPTTTWEQFDNSIDLAFKTYVTQVTTKHPTETTVKCEPPTVVAGQKTKCTATVTDTATSGQTLPTGTVSFSTSGTGGFSPTSCTLSGSGASASCSVTYTPKSTPANPVRTDTITATYEGDAKHEGSKGTTTVTVISPTALAHGSFVIGDENAVVGKSVTFYEVEWWGSNWWKLNSLSGGPAPSDFKGFAESSPSPPECDRQWTTNSGNSSGPPAAVPEYMEVIGASKITQSGPTITGNTRKLAVVKTNPGYLPDPGHKGTGKVVAVIKCL
jgi:hypothetical protein